VVGVEIGTDDYVLKPSRRGIGGRRRSSARGCCAGHALRADEEKPIRAGTWRWSRAAQGDHRRLGAGAVEHEFQLRALSSCAPRGACSSSSQILDAVGSEQWWWAATDGGRAHEGVAAEDRGGGRRSPGLGDRCGG